MQQLEVGQVWTPKDGEAREVMRIYYSRVYFLESQLWHFCTKSAWLCWVREKEATCSPK